MVLVGQKSISHSRLIKIYDKSSYVPHERPYQKFALIFTAHRYFYGLLIVYVYLKCVTVLYFYNLPYMYYVTYFVEC